MVWSPGTAPGRYERDQGAITHAQVPHDHPDDEDSLRRRCLFRHLRRRLRLRRVARPDDSGLGAGSAVVAACGTGTNAAYSTTYSASIPGYSVSQVNLSAIPAACLSKSYKIQLTGASGVAVGSEMSGTLPASGTTATIATSGTPDASLVTGVSVVIS